MRDDVGANGLKNIWSTCSTGLEWRGVGNLAQKATMPRKGFLDLKAPTFLYNMLYNIVLILYIFLLCRLKLNKMIELGVCVYSWVC